MKENNKVYVDLKEMSEVLNKNFRKVFTAESDLKKLKRLERKVGMWEISINREEIEEQMKKLDGKKRNRTR